MKAREMLPASLACEGSRSYLHRRRALGASVLIGVPWGLQLALLNRASALPV